MPSKRPPASSAGDSDAADSFSAPFRAPHSKRRTPRPLPPPHPAPAARSHDRRNRRRAFPDSTTLAVALMSPHLSAASPSLPGGKMWSDEDEIALLDGAADFRARTGAPPRLPDMPVLYDALRDTIAPHLDQAKVYYKLKRIKSKFMHTAQGDNVTSHELRVRELCAIVWPEDFVGTEEENGQHESENEGDGSDRVDFPALRDAVMEYWKANSASISKASLEKGLNGIDEEDGRALEGKWRKQMEAEARTRMRWHDLAREVCGMMAEAVKGVDP